MRLWKFMEFYFKSHQPVQYNKSAFFILVHIRLGSMIHLCNISNNCRFFGQKWLTLYGHSCVVDFLGFATNDITGGMNIHQAYCIREEINFSWTFIHLKHSIHIQPKNRSVILGTLQVNQIHLFFPPCSLSKCLTRLNTYPFEGTDLIQV